MLQELKTANKVVGIKQLKKSLRAGKAVHVFLADDADPMVTEPLLTDCNAAGVEVTKVPTMQELGRACGISVGAAAAAIIV